MIEMDIKTIKRSPWTFSVYVGESQVGWIEKIPKVTKRRQRAPEQWDWYSWSIGAIHSNRSGPFATKEQAIDFFISTD